MRLSLIFQVLTIILSPLYIIRGGVPLSFLGISSIPFTLLELMILLTFGITLIEFIRTKSHIDEVRTQFDYLILFILGVGLFSVFISPDTLGGLGIFKAYFVEPVLFFYCLIFTKRKYQTNYIIPSLIIAAFWISLWGLLQKFTGSYSLAFHEIINDRITGPYNSANALALFIGPVIPIVLALFFKYKKMSLKVTLLLLITFFTLIIYWTKSRGGLIAEIGALAVFVSLLISIRFYFLRKLLIILPILFIVFSFLFFYLMHSLYGERIADSGFRVLNDTLQIRYAIWISTVEILTQNPILGTGLNGFESTYLDYRLHDYPEPFLYPHNFLLTVWTELGLLGLMLFLLLLYKIYKLNTLSLLESKSLYAVAYLASFTYIMIHGLVDVPYFKNDLSLVFWIFIALTQLEFEHIKERT
jgi:putative inorganic carbon (hco3(-)) transporter